MVCVHVCFPFLHYPTTPVQLLLFFVCMYQSIEDKLDRARHALYQEDEHRRVLINLVTVVTHLWLSITIQFIMPKDEVRAMTAVEYTYLTMNVLGVFLCFTIVIYAIDSRPWVLVNYSYSYWLYISLFLPRPGVPTSSFVPLWFLGLLGYLMLAIYTETAPFIKYPYRELKIIEQPPRGTKRNNNPSSDE